MARTASAGNKYSFLGFLDDDGFLIGGTPDAPAAGEASGMLRLTGIKEVPITIPDSDIISATGDDTNIADFDFDSDQPRRYIATMAVEDLNLITYLTGVDQATIAGGSWADFDVVDAPERTACLIHQQRAVDLDSGKAWKGILVRRATVKYLGQDSMNERTPSTFRLSVTPQPAMHDPWGFTLQKLARFKKFQSAYPYTMSAFTGDGAETTFHLDYEPVEVAKSQATVERIARTITSVDPAYPYGFTLSLAAVGNGRGQMLYQFRG